MIVNPYHACTCQRMGNTHALCQGQLTLGEQGKRLHLSLKQGEQALAIVLDRCVMQDNLPKCDGLYLWKSHNRSTAVLIELKGAGDIPKAFAQLGYVRHQRPEYQTLVAYWRSTSALPVQQKAVIVTNGLLSKPELERLERQHNIRVSALLHCEHTTPTPDLRPYL
ncbi:hypothetical protein [Halomonas llamarensis]|uniref:VRR-NUC domain-containing protein n=1 Tax=Halomonas llamarensis TaxID=2945104 RepID=A0ABT0SU13_9GAMM|nr:hypothetical protein [Halomonas llamarensis]MCL7931063.1 hypothetical protein [Halomonas llamarensis]